MEARWLLPAPGHILQCSNARRKSGLQKSSGWLTILEPITVTLGDQVWVICPVQSPKAVSDLLVVWVEAEVKVKGCCDFEWGGQGRPSREGGTWAETWGRGKWLLGFAPEQLEGVRITFYWGGKAVEEQVWVWGEEVWSLQGEWGLSRAAPHGACAPGLPKKREPFALTSHFSLPASAHLVICSLLPHHKKRKKQWEPTMTLKTIVKT